jgi:GrpB-like predicted nucleotidyltransferase (UPF0157 family)
MSNLQFRPAQELRPVVDQVLKRVVPGLLSLLPGAQVEHIGATAVAGALTKGDLDISVQVPAGDFSNAVQLLKQRFTIKQPENWSAEFASFGDDSNYELRLGIQLVVKGSSDDIFVFLRDYLNAHPDVVGAYNQLKREHFGGSQQDYWEAKENFFAKILASRT